ncbi:MAG: NRAMP family divalent metal transporter [Acidimicrobiales bacterium]
MPDPEVAGTLESPGREVLDEAHSGDIKGAFGTIRSHGDAPPRSWPKRLAALLVVMGPGLIVMIGDNDAGGVATYAQAGQDYGLTMLWVLPLLVPVLMVSQEMVVRLGAVTGVGHGRLIKERFGRLWMAFSVVDLFVLNFLTIVTEFIGVDLALGYFGVSAYVSVPIAAAALVAATLSGSFQRWERAMYVLIIASMLVVPLVVMAHPVLAPVATHLVVPAVAGGFTSTSVLVIIAIVGTTIAPWQLFFQQSNVVDKRITPRWVVYERADTFIGAFVVVIAAGAIMVTAAFAFGHSAYAGHFVSAGRTASEIGSVLGPLAGQLFAIVLLDASLLGAAAVSLSTSYALADVLGIKHSLHRGIGSAKGFYVIFTVMLVLAAGVVLVPGAPLGLVTVAVQALAGILLPSAIVFLLLLCNDSEILGPWVNPPWLNVLAVVIVLALVELSLVLMVTTVFPAIDVTLLTEALTAGLGGGGLAVLLYGRLRRASAREQPRARRSPGPGAGTGSPQVAGLRPKKEERYRWAMPALALLSRPKRSLGVRLGMYSMRVYLVVAVVVLVVKAVELGFGR